MFRTLIHWFLILHGLYTDYILKTQFLFFSCVASSIDLLQYKLENILAKVVKLSGASKEIHEMGPNILNYHLTKY